MYLAQATIAISRIFPIIYKSLQNCFSYHGTSCARSIKLTYLNDYYLHLGVKYSNIDTDLEGALLFSKTIFKVRVALENTANYSYPTATVYHFCA